MPRYRTFVTWIALALTTMVLAGETLGCASRTCEPASINQRAGGGACIGGLTGYMWTGSSCIMARSCNGDRPDQLYPTQSSCETAHIGCTSRR